jgi:hypothetical protein
VLDLHERLQVAVGALFVSGGGLLARSRRRADRRQDREKEGLDRARHGRLLCWRDLPSIAAPSQ